MQRGKTGVSDILNNTEGYEGLSAAGCDRMKRQHGGHRFRQRDSGRTFSGTEVLRPGR